MGLRRETAPRRRRRRRFRAFADTGDRNRGQLRLPLFAGSGKAREDRRGRVGREFMTKVRFVSHACHARFIDMPLGQHYSFGRGFARAGFFALTSGSPFLFIPV
jgi:hypothetical protein